MKLAAGLDLALAGVRDATETVEEVAENPSSALHDFPLVVRKQPLEWWEQVIHAADRMAEAMRSGRRLEPRTPAEEAVVLVCIQSGWIGIVYDEMSDDGSLEAEFEEVPELAAEDAALRPGHGRDYPWDEVLPAITGDGDIELLWSPEHDGFEDPDETSNRYLGVGDYRPRSWHRFFDRNVNDSDTPHG